MMTGRASRGRAGRRDVGARARAASSAQMSAWRRSLPAIRRNAAARRGSFSIVASASYSTIASRSSLRFSRLCAMSMRRPCLAAIARRDRADVDSGRMAGRLARPLRYLAAADVTAAMPPLDERLRARRADDGRAASPGAELPPKIGVHPRPDGSFAHAMPAYLRGPSPTAADDLLGMKWVAGFPANSALGLPAIHAPRRPQRPRDRRAGRDPRRRPDHGRADGGVSRRRDPRASAPRGSAGRAPRAALIGAGVQGHSHLAGPRPRPAGRRARRSSTAIRTGRGRLAEARATTDGIAAAGRRRRRATRSTGPTSSSPRRRSGRRPRQLMTAIG